MKRSVVLTLWALALMVFAPPLSAAPLVLSKNADGTISAAGLSLTLSSNTTVDQTSNLIPDGSKLISDRLDWKVNDKGFGTFAGPVRIGNPDGKVILRAFIHGTIGLTSCRSNDESRVANLLQGMINPAGDILPAQVGPTSTTALLGPIPAPMVVEINVTAQDNSGAGGVGAYTAHLDGIIDVPPPPPPPLNQVFVQPNKLLYNPAETIVAIVANRSATDITTKNGKSNCTIVQLQRLVGDAWTDVEGCALTVMPQDVVIKAGETKEVHLPAVQSAGRPAGTYRLTLTYQPVTASGTPPPDPITVVSAVFKVGTPPPPSGVVVKTDKLEYQPWEAWVGSATNATEHDIRGNAVYTYCTIFQVQKMVSGAWQPVGPGCGPTDSFVIIKPGQTVTARLPMESYAPLNNEPGTYRMAFKFQRQDSTGAWVDPVTVFSNVFRVVPALGGVKLAPSKMIYAPHELITGLLANGLQYPIGLKNGKSFCTVLELQRLTETGEWKTTYLCNPPPPTPDLITVAPGETRKVGLPEAAIPEFAYDPGTYRLVARYVVLTPNSTTPPAEVTIVSDRFMVQGTPPPPPPTGVVMVGRDKSQYSGLDTIVGRVANGLAAGIQAFDGQSDCTILQLQIKDPVTGAWTKVERCPLEKPSMPVVIPAGEVRYFFLPPGPPDAAGNVTPHAPGTYQLLLTYQVLGPDAKPVGDPVNVASEPFTVIATPPMGHVTVSPSQKVYAPTNPITAILANNTTMDVNVLNQKSFCTIVTLLKQTTTNASGWQEVAGCPMMGPGYQPVTLKAGTTMNVVLPPDATTVPKWEPGIYMLRIDYFLFDPNHPTPQVIMSATSDPFTVASSTITNGTAFRPTIR